MFTERTAMVTGVTSGIGAALTSRLLAAGMTVVGVARDELRLAAAARDWGGSFHPVVADLSDPDAVLRCVVRAGELAPRLDVLVNNAAEAVYDPPSTADWPRLLQTNALSAITLVQRLLPRLGGGGHIVTISSVTSRFLPDAHFAPYAVSKVALDKFTEALRLELRGTAIKVSLVVLGLVDTPLYTKVDGFERTGARLAEQVPDWLRPDDVADVVHWLLTRPAHVVVGAVEVLPVGQAR